MLPLYLQAMEEEFKDVVFIKVDVDDNSVSSLLLAIALFKVELQYEQ